MDGRASLCRNDCKLHGPPGTLSDMESKKQKGLYFVGEVLDVSGPLGGFNFQWAWSSAHAASQYV